MPMTWAPWSEAPPLAGLAATVPADIVRAMASAVTAEAAVATEATRIERDRFTRFSFSWDDCRRRPRDRPPVAVPPLAAASSAGGAGAGLRADDGDAGE